MENGVANHVFDIIFIIKLAAIIVPLIGISFILRNLLGADKKKWFSYNHINDFHKKRGLEASWFIYNPYPRIVAVDYK